MHLAVPKHNVLVIILKNSDQCFRSIGCIHTPNYLELVPNNIVYCRFQTVFSPQIIIIFLMSQLKIYTKTKIAFKKQNLEQCIFL